MRGERQSKKVSYTSEEIPKKSQNISLKKSQIPFFWAKKSEKVSKNYQKSQKNPKSALES